MANGSVQMEYQRTVSRVDFEKVKELVKEAIDEGITIAEIIQIAAEKIYKQGIADGVEKANEL